MTRREARDPLLDLIRVVAVCGVVLGHWLVTPLVPTANGVIAASPLTTLPELTPLSWFLQTLGLFFFVGGFAAARGLRSAEASGITPARWWLARLRRCAVPVLGLSACWLVLLVVLAVQGTPQQTVATAAQLLTTPLWFLVVYLVLLAVTPIARRLDRRFGLAAVLIPGVLALIAEATARWADGWFGQAIGLTTVVTVWWVPWQLGTALGGGRRIRPIIGLWMAIAGAAALLFLVRVLDYPAAAVGLPGADRSNLVPPSPVVLALAVAQVGVVLLAARPLRALTARSLIATVVHRVDRHALAIFLLHQNALIAVTLIAIRFATLPGLHTVPADLGWVGVRLLWLPVFAAVLLLMLATSARLVGGRGRTGAPQPRPTTPATVESEQSNKG
ncbi:acyltransferase family protein [Actinoalloteichus hymeniacidonis]|uniref:Acyltransferase family protein n=1 Tax=Actinoalloteichus hymeniacidonis TaxID=340345 RepID=A0AAC9HT08_9PSEU|nr:acyltransferase [Actinoalloteichus hymeniacidonis]AOS64401.1 acyltransferase family protein [Actinoalloteichus hymeniacidonis]MBB5907531.1 peptidoglycan/LPS O-acetylase OafA/YrhL [Actinoalloteichus hymeniacidonis]